MGGLKSILIRVISADARVVAESLQPVIAPEIRPSCIGSVEQTLEVGEGAPPNHVLAPAARAAAAKKLLVRIVRGQLVQPI